MLYYVFVVFQAFCLFHVYKSRNEYFWYIIIFFIPVIGGLFYLFTQVITRSNLTDTYNQITAVLDPNKKIRDLEKKISFSDTFQNTIDLADAHFQNKNYEKAITYYEKSLTGKFENDPSTLNKALKCYFQLKQYEQVVACASKINIDNYFRNSICIYAISLDKCNYFDEAEVQFRKIDKRYCNYAERLEFSHFFINRGKNDSAALILKEINSEIENMTDRNKRKYQLIYKESNKLMKEI
jgi:hypothetical protein